jgi:hypothetical protein
MAGDIAEHMLSTAAPASKRKVFFVGRIVLVPSR